MEGANIYCLKAEASFESGKRPIFFEQGFSLLELLVGLAMLGFLIMMTMPRMGGFMAKGMQIVSDTNMDRLIRIVTVSRNRTGNYPSGMINLVSVDSSNEYHKPMLTDLDPANGPEVLSQQLDYRHRLAIHYLCYGREFIVYHHASWNSVSKILAGGEGNYFSSRIAAGTGHVRSSSFFEYLKH